MHGYIEMIKTFRQFNEAADYSNSGGQNFWGDIGAGVLPFCIETKRFLVAFRSEDVNEPHTFGILGGALDEIIDNNVKDTATREFKEETEYDGDLELIPLYVYKVHNFLGIIPHEFEPVIDWETEYCEWITYDELIKLHPKHFGLKALLDNSTNEILRYIK